MLLWFILFGSGLGQLHLYALLVLLLYWVYLISTHSMTSFLSSILCRSIQNVVNTIHDIRNAVLSVDYALLLGLAVCFLLPITASDRSKINFREHQRAGRIVGHGELLVNVGDAFYTRQELKWDGRHSRFSGLEWA